MAFGGADDPMTDLELLVERTDVWRWVLGAFVVGMALGWFL